MESLYLDTREYITTHSSTSDNLSKKIGHVHLKVGDIAAAIHFYGEVLGLRLVAQLPSALFFSDGQYHHHLGMNTWESQGAGLRPPSLGLKSITIKVADTTDLEYLQDRLTANDIQFVKEVDSVVVNDPWGNKLKLTN
jgi:catechol 2,3-dioxygenase